MEKLKINLITPEHIKDMVECLTSVADMAAMLTVDEYDLRQRLEDPEDELCTFYRATIAKVRMEIRQRDMDLAESCSPTAMERVHNYLKRMEDDL